MTHSLTRTRIKFCGMMRETDVIEAADLGVDAIGFIFAHHSKRKLCSTRARQLRACVPPLVTTIALFCNNSAESIQEAMQAAQPDILQFHGQEDAAFCAQFQMPYLKAIAMHTSANQHISKQLLEHRCASGFLFDSHHPGGNGGTGHVFDWDTIPQALQRPLFLAGGIHPDNVQNAITTVHPYAVDVCSGIEHSAGVKDSKKMSALVRNVRCADAAMHS